MGLPMVVGGAALVVYGFAKNQNPNIENDVMQAIEDTLVGRQKTLAQIINNYAPFIQSASSAYGVPWQYIVGIIWQESRGKPKAYRYEPKLGEASYGLMQTLESTARSVGFTGQAENLYDPSTSINYGTKYLSVLYSKYGNWDDTVMSYNAGHPGTSAGQTYLVSVSDTVSDLNDMIQQGEVTYG